MSQREARPLIRVVRHWSRDAFQVICTLCTYLYVVILCWKVKSQSLNNNIILLQYMSLISVLTLAPVYLNYDFRNFRWFHITYMYHSIVCNMYKIKCTTLNVLIFDAESGWSSGHELPKPHLLHAFRSSNGIGSKSVHSLLSRQISNIW